MAILRPYVIFAGFVTMLSLLLVLLFPVAPLHAAATVPRVLVINSYNMGYDWWEDEMTGFQDELLKAFPRVEMYVEHLDTKKFHSKQHFPAAASLLESKYSNRKLDVIIAMDNAALEFASHYRQRFSPGTPLIFCGINDYKPAMIAGQPRITGVAELHDFVGTLDLALRLHPSTRDIVVIHDFTDSGQAIHRELEQAAGRYSSIRFHFMDEMPLEDAVQKLKEIPQSYLALMLTYTVEKGGRTFSHMEAAKLVSNASPVPVYSVYAAQLGSGVVGGNLLEGQAQGRDAAKLAIRVLKGEAAENLPVITTSSSRPMFDYAGLKRFDIDPARLPADALIINTPPTTFAINKTAVWLGVAFALLCTLGLIGMTLNIRKRRRLEEMLHLQIDQHQKAQEELQVTEEMLRAQVDDYMQSQDELHATEEALRVQLNVVEESSQKFKAVFEHSPITVALTTLPEGTFSEVNQTFVDMFGYAREEAIGKTTLELGVWQHESDRIKFLQRLKEQRFVHNFEVEMRRKNGEVITVLFSGVLLEMSDKLTVLSAIMEISEQKRLQNQLYQTQKMDVVGQLAGGIAHDFNNMLAGIMAASELLKRRLPGDDKNHKLVDTIMEAAVRSADLTRELLTFARKGTALTAPVKIHGIITAVIALLERTIDKQILLVARLEADNPIVLGDQTLLQNALLNLGVNARDAMPQGGTLTFTTSEKVLDETACRSIGLDLSPGRYLEIVVSDTGIGMATEVMEHIFEPFFTTKAIGKGTGLGLASVYGAVKNHSGDVVVRSQSGIGSIFTLYLPLAGEELHQQPAAAEIVTGSGGILLVDDEEILRDLGRELLENMGYTVYVAADGLQALDVFETHRSEIKLVILDMIMPKLGGKDTFLRLHAQSPDVKVLFCSGFSHEGTGAELVGLGANGFIQKPYTRIQLSQAVADALGAP